MGPGDREDEVSDSIPDVPPEVVIVASLTMDVAEAGGDEHDLMARLIAQEGDAEAFRMLAFVHLLEARTIPLEGVP